MRVIGQETCGASKRFLCLLSVPDDWSVAARAMSFWHVLARLWSKSLPSDFREFSAGTYR